MENRRFDITAFVGRKQGERGRATPAARHAACARKAAPIGSAKSRGRGETGKRKGLKNLPKSLIIKDKFFVHNLCVQCTQIFPGPFFVSPLRKRKGLFGLLIAGKCVGHFGPVIAAQSHL